MLTCCLATVMDPLRRPERAKQSEALKGACTVLANAAVQPSSLQSHSVALAWGGGGGIPKRSLQVARLRTERLHTTMHQITSRAGRSSRLQGYRLLALPRLQDFEQDRLQKR